MVSFVGFAPEERGRYVLLAAPATANVALASSPEMDPGIVFSWMKSTSPGSKHSSLRVVAEKNCPEINVKYLGEMLSSSCEAQPLTVSVARFEMFALWLLKPKGCE